MAAGVLGQGENRPEIYEHPRKANQTCQFPVAKIGWIEAAFDLMPARRHDDS
jgi:hypothetical protein